MTCAENRAHNNADDREFEVTIAKAGGKRCSSCGATVLRTEGCNHMTCRCKHEFCYICGANWKPKACSHGFYDGNIEVAAQV
jgi:hypothetical protein